MNSRKEIRIIENLVPRHWGISLMCVLVMLLLLFFSICFGWILVFHHNWAEFGIELVMTVLAFVFLANLVIWNLCGRETIAIGSNQITVTRKRFIPYVKTYYYCDLDYIEYKPFESTDAFSRWCERLGRKGGMIHIVQFGINDYLGIAMRKSDADRLIMEIQERMYKATD